MKAKNISRVEGAALPQKSKPLTIKFPTTKEIKRAKSMATFQVYYSRIRLCAAAVKNFDFGADRAFYAAFVEGRTEDARKLTSKRFSAATKAGAKSLTGSAIRRARTAYSAAYSAATLKESFAYPKHLVKVEKGLAHFSDKRPKKVKSAFGDVDNTKPPFGKDR